MSDLMTQFQGQVNDEIAKKAQEEDLTPKGFYQFTVHSWEPVENKEFFDQEETRRNPFFGHPVANVRLDLWSRAEKEKGTYETMERPRTYFVKVCPDLVYRESNGRLENASKLFGDMVNVLKKAGAPIGSVIDVINYFKENRGVIHIGQYEAGERDGRSWDAGNRVYGIKPVPQGA